MLRACAACVTITVNSSKVQHTAPAAFLFQACDSRRAMALSTREMHSDNQLSVLQRWCIATFLDYKTCMSNAWLSLYSLVPSNITLFWLRMQSIKLCCQITFRYQHCGNVMLSISLTKTYTLLQGISRVLVYSSLSAHMPSYHYVMMIIPCYSYDDCFEYLFILCLLFG